MAVRSVPKTWDGTGGTKAFYITVCRFLADAPFAPAGTTLNLPETEKIA